MCLLDIKVLTQQAKEAAALAVLLWGNFCYWYIDALIENCIVGKNIDYWALH